MGRLVPPLPILRDNCRGTSHRAGSGGLRSESKQLAPGPTGVGWGWQGAMSNCRVLGRTAGRRGRGGGFVEAEAAETALWGSGATADGHARDRLRTWQKSAMFRARLMEHTQGWVPQPLKETSHFPWEEPKAVSARQPPPPPAVREARHTDAPAACIVTTIKQDLLSLELHPASQRTALPRARWLLSIAHSFFQPPCPVLPPGLVP